MVERFLSAEMCQYQEPTRFRTDPFPNKRHFEAQIAQPLVSYDYFKIVSRAFL